MIVGRAFSLLRRRAAQTRRGLALLVEAEVVQLPLERREPVVSEINTQSRFQALAVVDDDAAVRVPGQDLALLLEHLVELDDEIIRRDAAQLLGEGTPRGGGARGGRRLGHGVLLEGLRGLFVRSCRGRGCPRRAAVLYVCGGGASGLIFRPAVGGSRMGHVLSAGRQRGGRTTAATSAW